MTVKQRQWVHGFVNYAGLAAFLATLAITRSAVTASWAVVIGSLAALVVGFVVDRKIATMPLATAVLGVIFGGLTILFHDERFIKVKPTILYAAFGVFLVGGVLTGRNPLKTLMGDAFHLPDPVVRILTWRYAAFFFAMAAMNEIVWRTQSTLVWGFYKFPGAMILIVVFTLSQAPLMAKHMEEDAPKEEPKA